MAGHRKPGRDCADPQLEQKLRRSEVRREVAEMQQQLAAFQKHFE